ncbi:MAG: hypothetical protein HOP21_10380 [Methylotenera sp.]|nr:hypothetical protein [Methylotenera sp.]
MYEQIIEPQIQILKRCQAAWDAQMPNLPEDLTPYGGAFVTKAWIRKSFSMIIDNLEAMLMQSADGINPALIQSVSQNFPSWTTPIESWIATGVGTVPNIVSHLNAMWSQFQAHGFNPIPSEDELHKIAAENKRLQQEAKDLLSFISDLSEKKNKLTEVLEMSERLNKNSMEVLEAASKSKALIDADAAVSGAHRESIERDQLDAKKHLDALVAVTEKLPEFEQSRDTITKQCNEILAEATRRLEAASRAGMATSFSDRTKEYIWPRRLWLGVFVLSLSGVFGVAYCFIIPEIKDFEGVERVSHFVTELPLTLPFIWLAWFSALRFSQLGRLSEDYAFKVATALALDGYRTQAQEVKPELQEKLLDLAITNFGENPLRLMTKDSAKDAHPLAGSLDEKTLNEIVKSAFQALSDKVGK